MKKKVLSTILCLGCVFLAGCGKAKEKSAAQIVSELQEAGYPIDEVEEYTENNDPDDLLGRPGQYIQKIIFSDMRFDQSVSDSQIGGSIEIFKNSSDCKKRADYISDNIDSSPIAAEYSYQFDSVLLHLSKELPPEEAEAYSVAVKGITKDKSPDPFVLDEQFIVSFVVIPDKEISRNQLDVINNTIKSLPIIPDSLEFYSAEENAEVFFENYFPDDQNEIKENLLSGDLAEGFSASFDFEALPGYSNHIKRELSSIDGVSQVNRTFNN